MSNLVVVLLVCAVMESLGAPGGDAQVKLVVVAFIAAIVFDAIRLVISFRRNDG